MPGNYHFRFKCPLIPGTDREKGAVSVWMDCVDDDQHVGVWRNTIFAKVTRINMDEEDDDEFARPAPNHGSNGVHHATPASAPAPREVPRATQKPTRAPVPPPQPAPPASSGDANLLGGFDAHHVAPAASEGDLLGVAPVPSSGGGLLDMDGPATHHAPSSHSSAHDDFLGMTATPISSPPVSGGNAPTQVPQIPVQQQNRMNRPSSSNNAFNTFSNNAGPFGGLEWK